MGGRAARSLGCAWLAGLWVLACLLAGEAAADTKRMEAGFAAWREALWSEAQAAGVSRPTFDGALRGLALDWSLPDLELGAADRKPAQQAEFGSPGRYFGPSNLAVLVSRSRAERDKRRAILAAIEARYGVPHQILLAIWGRETAHGTVSIPHDAIRALATQSYAGRRAAFFRPQLIAALRLLEQGHATRKVMRSSWAGAMGHTQMLPTHILQYGVDFDGDGRRNVWGSVADALASTAHFLGQNGWQAGLPWGYEVTPPEGADCTLEGPDQGRPFAEWLAMGYRRTWGRSFPPGRLATRGHLLMPAGRHGPAFLVTGNFYALKAYNESDLYALYVGHLADRVDNDRGFEGRWAEVPTYPRGEIMALQKVLVGEGYNVGDSIDGLVGFRTRTAVGRFQRKNGLTVDCWPGPETLARARRQG